MQQSEFDRFADEYQQQHAASIRLSGEEPEYFARYKAQDTASLVRARLPRNSILDFGTGIGNALPHLREAFPDSDIVGLDMSQRSLEIAQARFPHAAQLRHFDGSNIPYAADSFGLVFVACVFHHIDHRDHVDKLCEIRRVLAPTGWLILYEHNPWNPLTVRSVNECPFDENAVLISAPAMKRRALHAGFAQARIRYRVFFPSMLAPLRRLERALWWLPLGAQYCLACRK